ncbi:MAG: mechanosensitive ion channel family protein [Bacteriovoracia bacterium]
MEDLLNESWREFLFEKVLFFSGKLLLIFTIAWIVYLIAKWFLNTIEEKLKKRHSCADGEPPSETLKRVDTLNYLIRRAVYSILAITFVLIFFKEIGINIGPLLASAGIVGLAVGFGAQSLVKDIISGFFLILENQIRVGDVAIINGQGGFVEHINFRTTVMRDFSGNVHVFPNGNISTLANMTKDWSGYVMDMGVAYKEDTDHVVEVIQQVGKELKADPYFGAKMIDDVEVFGVDSFADSAVTIKIRLKTKPIQQWEVGREFRRRIKKAFDKAKIEIPFPHRTIYMGEASPPFVVLQKKIGVDSE